MPSRWTVILLLILTTTYSNSLGSSNLIDGFDAGIDSLYWSLSTNQALYTVDDSNGDVRFAKPIGGSAFQYIRLDLGCDFEGDFDVSVRFSDAMINRVNGAPGNQVQLTLAFGGQLFVMVRSDELPGGDNVHVFLSPPASWIGAQPTTATQGTLRVTRTGTTVAGYLDESMIHSGTYNDAPVTFTSIALQNNGTNDPTSVTFDDFALAADSIDCPLVTAIDVPSMGSQLDIAAYPNPFNPSTTIAFDLPVETRAVVQVFDVGGHLVRSLLDEECAAGPFHVRWDGRDGMGAIAASGVYYIRLLADKQLRKKKILLLK